MLTKENFITNFLFLFLNFTIQIFYRKSLNAIHKIRRHLNDQPRAGIKSTGIKGIMYRPTWSASQLSVDVSELHADSNGRLEISCLSTIPAKLLQPGDEYADFKIYSVKSK